MRETMVALLGLSLLSIPAGAQEKAEPTPTPTRKNPIPIKVQVVFARYAGEKKISNLPYALSLGAPGRPARLRMGIEVPVSVGKGTGTLQYKNVGANLDCSAEPLEDGRYRLELTVVQSSIYAPEGDKTNSDSPLFRSFNASFTEFLRDTQSATHVLAADPVSGEVLKLDVTLALIK